MRIVVVGLGPAGIVATRVLAHAGLRVVGIQPRARGRHPLASPCPTRRRHADEHATLARAPQAGADGIGGSKLLAAAQSYRRHPATFRTHPATPDGTLDWPIGPADLAPYDARVEALHRVAPRPATPWTTRMRTAATRQGWHPIAAPAAAARDASPLLPADVPVVDGTATRIITSPTGAVREIEYCDPDGGRRVLACDAVVLAAGTIASIRLLLLSGLEAGGLVGSGFTTHNAFTVNGWFADEDLGRDAAGPASAVAVTDMETGPRDPEAAGFTGGSLLQAAMTGPRTDDWRRAVADGLSPELAGGDALAWVRRHEIAIGTVWAQPDQLPDPAHRVDLDPTHTDHTGRPVARITYDLREDDVKRWRFLTSAMTRWLEAAGATRTWAAPIRPQPLGTHLYGGIRMGSDPSTSVVDGFGFAHRTPGLVVLGTSTFPTPGGRGPVQTIEALAWRSAERLAAALSVRPRAHSAVSSPLSRQEQQ